MSNEITSLEVTVDKGHIITIGERLYEQSIELIRELVNNAYDADATRVEVTVSDGDIDVTRTLMLHLDNWVETFLEEMKVKATTKSWKVEVEGDQGLTLYLVIEDAEGNTSSFPLIYEDGKYRAEVPEDAAEKDLEFWIAEEEGGEAIGGAYSGVLPALKKESGAFPWWVVLLILIFMALAGAVLYVVFTRSGGYGGEVGDIDEE